MSPRHASQRHQRLKRIGWTAFVALLCGGFGWNVVADAILGLGTTGRTVLWGVFALLGGWLYWNEPEDARRRLDPRVVEAIAITAAAAVAAVVLLKPPLSGWVALLIAVAGAIGITAYLRRTMR